MISPPISRRQKDILSETAGMPSAKSRHWRTPQDRQPRFFNDKKNKCEEKREGDSRPCGLKETREIAADHKV